MLEDIKKFVDDYINPALAGHNGVLYVDSISEDKKTLYVRLGGMCVGCGSSKFTLQQQVKSYLVEEFPSLSDIIDLTDHEGNNIG